LNCPKVRHYLGGFYGEKSNTIMNLNFTVEEVLRKHRSVNSVANENSIASSNLNRWIRFYVELETRVFYQAENKNQ
jgi:hypothetical protein